MVLFGQPMCIWVHSQVVFDLTVVYVVRCQASTITLWYTVFSSLVVGTFSHQPGPILLLHIAKDQERYFGTNLMTTMMRMILYMNLAVCILILE